MTILQMIRSLLCPEPVVEHSQAVERPFSKLYHRTGEHVESVLRAAFPEAHIRIADADYSAPTFDEFDLWLQTDDVSDMIYRKNYRDCDNFSRKLRCRIFAISDVYKTEITLCYVEGHAPSGYHAFCIFIDNDDNILILEPQSDCLTPYRESDYKPDFIQL